MNTDTKQNINANIYIRTNADTSVNNRTYLHFHAGIYSTPILMGLLYTDNDINIQSNASTSYKTCNYLLPYVSNIEI